MFLTPRPALVGLIALALASCGTGPSPSQPSPPPNETPVAPVDPDRTPPRLRLPEDVHPLGYAVDLRVIPGEARFGGTVEVRLRLDRPRRVVWLNASDLHVTSATIGGRTATWSAVAPANGFASVSLPEDAPPLEAGETTLSITYDAAFSHGGDSVFAVAEEGRHYALTTFEPVSARKALPCFDEPALKAPFDLALTVPADAVALANAPELDATPLEQGLKRVRFARTAPLPTYLFAFAVGPFDVVSAPSLAASPWRSTPLPIRGVALFGKGQRLREQLSQVGPLVAAVESWFASPYPFAKLDVVAVPGYPGAMENAALVMVNEGGLMVDRSAGLEEQRDAILTLAHEVSHQWFGDFVTMAWWDDLWLNEAFATWLAVPIAGQVRPDLDVGAARRRSWRKAMRADAKASVRRIRQPITSENDIYSAFDAITYSKGSSIIAMFERWVGPGVWQAGVRAYLAAHPFGNATVDDLLTAVSAAVGRDIATPFRSFLDTTGAPLVTITLGEKTAGGTRVAFDVERWRPAGSTAPASGAWQVPVCLAGAGLTDERCVLLDGPHTEIELAVSPDATTLVPNAGGSGYYQTVVRPASLVQTSLAKPRSAAEASALVASYTAAFDCGAMSASEVLDVLAPLSESDEPELVRAPLELLTRIGDHMISETTRPSFERRVRGLFAKARARLGWQPRPDEAAETRSLRASLIAFLAETARDPSVRREAARRGRAILRGLTAKPGTRPLTAAGTAPELRAIALAVALQEGGPEHFEMAERALFASGDPLLRGELLEALGSVRAPELAARARALVLDTRVTETEMLTPLEAQLDDVTSRGPALAWLEQNIDAVLARAPPFEACFTPAILTDFCDGEARERIERLFSPHIEALPGTAQSLAETLELVDLCRALNAEQGESVRQWLGISAR